jgi:glycosyltransferase involved in cell wall biosynthesis
VDVSVIVPSYRSAATLQACVRSLLDQRFGGSYEVIVSASADTAAELPSLDPHPVLRVLTHVPRLSAAAARNRGAAQASGALLAFTDADVEVDPQWLYELVRASADGSCVAGAVRNGTPESGPGTVEYLVEFFDLHPRRPPRTAWHGATCNLAVPRDLWDELGPYPEDMGGGEDTVLTVAARELGRFRFAPAATIVHRNRTSLPVVLAHQQELGRFTAHVGRRSAYKLRPLVRYSPLAPIAAVLRVASLYARVAAWTPRELPRALRLLPMIIAAYAAWGAGLLSEGARLDIARLRGVRGSGGDPGP